MSGKVERGMLLAGSQRVACLPLVEVWVITAVGTRVECFGSNKSLIIASSFVGEKHRLKRMDEVIVSITKLLYQRLHS